MSFVINIDNTHTVTVTNVTLPNGSLVTTIDSATCAVIDSEGNVVESQNMTGDASSLVCQIGPLDLTENAEYLVRIRIVGDGATMSGQCPFIARYRSICDGVF